ncbi:hypothetical protein ACFQX6_65265 [Streptosporangium lutulentum]
MALLERTGRRVVLTSAGIALVGHAEAVLERLERASAELAAARTGLTGTIRIGAFPTATRAILPAAFTVLAREHPGLEPMVDEIDPAEVAPACARATWTSRSSMSTTSCPLPRISPWTPRTCWRNPCIWLPWKSPRVRPRRTQGTQGAQEARRA